MFDFSKTFCTLAKLCKSDISTDTSKIESSFHLLQDAATEKLRDDQDDVILWDSGAPIPVLLGKSTAGSIDPIQGAVLLIACNTAAMASDAILSSDLDETSLNSTTYVFKAIGDILKEEINIFGNDDKEMINKIIPKISQLNNEDSLKDISKVTKCIQRSVFSMFSPKTIFGDFVFLILQFFVALQSFGIFELASARFQKFSKLESNALKSFKKLCEKDGENAIEMFRILNHKLEKCSSNIAKDKYLSGILIFLCKSLMQYVQQILRLIEKMSSGFAFDKFAIKEYEPLPNEFSSSFLSIFTADNVKHEYIKQLALSLNSFTKEPFIQYICSCATYYEKEIMGYSSLLSSLLVFEPVKEMEHLSCLLERFPNVLSKIICELNEIISKENLMNVNKTLEIMFKGIPKIINTPAEALQCIVIYSNLQPYFSESKKLEAFNSCHNNIIEVTLAWIISISRLVRLLEINLVKASIDIIDVQYNIKNNFKKILDNFNSLNEYKLCIPDFYQMFSMSKNVVEINKILFSKLEEIKTMSFISFANFIPNFQNIINLANLFNLYFDNLQECFKINTKCNGALLQQNASIFCQKMVYQIDNLITAITSQPEYVSSLVSDLIIQNFHLDFHMISLRISLSDFTMLLNKLSENITQKEKCIEISKELKIDLQDILQELLSSSVDVNILHKIRLSNKEDVSKLIAKIDSEEMKKETLYEIKSIYENPKYKHEQKKIEINLKKIIDMRMKNEYPIEISKIAQLNEKEIFDNSLAIAAMIPLYAGNKLEVIQKQIAPLILHNSSIEIQQVVRHTLVQYTFSDPLNEDLNKLITDIFNGETDIDGKIQEIANKYNITNLPVVKSEDQEQIFYQLLTLLAYSTIAPEGPFSEDKIRNWVKIIYNQKTSNEEVKLTVKQVLKSSLLTAMTTNTYDVQLMYKYQFVLSACESFLNEPTEYNRRSLVASICLLPTEMNQTSEITMNWGIAVALLNPSSINKLVDIADIDFYQYISDIYPLPVKPSNISSLSSHSSSIFSISRANSMLSNDEKLPLISPGDMGDISDDEPDVIYQDIIEEEEVGEPEVIEEIEEVYVEEDEDEEPINFKVIENVRVYELASHALNVYKKLCDSANSFELPTIKYVFEQFYFFVIELYDSTADDKVISSLESIKQIIMKLTDNDRSDAKNLSQYNNYFESLIKEPKVEDMLCYLYSLTKELLEKMDYPSENVLMSLDPLRRSIVINTPDILNTIKQMIKYLIDNNVSTYISYSTEELYNSIILLYILHHMFEYQDHELDMKCVSSCRRIQTALHLLLTNIKYNTDFKNFSKLESAYNDVIEKLNILLSNSDKSIIEFSKFDKDILIEHTIKRFDAQSLVYKRRKEVEEAEYQVKTLNEVE